MVASEIRKLSEQTKVYAINIEKILKLIQSSIAETRNQAKKSEETVQTGAQYSEKAKYALTQIIDNFAKNQNLLAEISDRTQHQNDQIQAVMQNAADLNEFTEKLSEAYSGEKITAEQINNTMPRFGEVLRTQHNEFGRTIQAFAGTGEVRKGTERIPVSF